MNKKNSRVLELTIISGESLTLTGNRQIKKNSYVVIKTESSSSSSNNNNNNNEISTSMDTENGSYPLWRQKFNVEMPMHATFFTLEVRCKNSSGDHGVGSVQVPVSDFTGLYFPDGYLHFLSYRLRDRYGGKNGVINISVKVNSSENGVGVGGDKAACSSSQANGWKCDEGKMGKGGSGGDMAACSSQATGWKYDGGKMGKGECSGAVIGVPVGY